MDIREVVQEWKNNIFRPIYVLYGKDRYRMEQCIEHLTNQLFTADEKELAVVKYDLTESPIQLAVDEAETMPFLTHKKLLLVRDSSLLCATTTNKEAAKIEHQINRLIDYMSNPCDTTIMVIHVHADKLDERKKLVKLFHSHTAVLVFDELKGQTLINWIVKRVKDQQRSIDQQAIQLLLMRTGEHLQKLATELDKLCLFVGTGGYISSQIVDQLIQASTEENVFALIEAMSSQKVDYALELYRQLLTRREEPIKIVALTARQLRHMVLIKQLASQSYSPNEIATRLGLRPFVVKLIAEQASKFSIASLITYIDHIVELDFKMKTGQIDKVLGMELFLLSFAAPQRQ